MSKQSYKYTNYNNFFHNINDNAFKYDLKKEDVDEKYRTIFEYYDTNNDDILNETELEKIKNDIDEANNDDDKSCLSSKEAKNLIAKLFPNQKISEKSLFKFLGAIEGNYKNIIETISDGVIDWTSQGSEGDCWLLSEVRALSQTEWGADAIKNSISNDTDNKVFTIKLKGVNFTCNISYEEVLKERKNKKRPKGDIDMLLLELATEKFFTQEVKAGRMEDNKKRVLYGGPLMGENTMQYLLTGNRGHIFYMSSERMSDVEIEEKSKEIMENEKDREYYTKYKDNISNLYVRDAKVKFMNELAQKIKNCSVTCAFKSTKNWENKDNYKKSEKKNDFNHQNRHAYVVEDIITDGNGNITEVLLNNPWQPHKIIHKSLDEFLDQVSSLCVTNEQDKYEDLEKLGEPCWVKVSE